MPRIMQETKKYMRQDDAISIKINKKAYMYTYMLDMHIYVNIYVKLKIIHQEVMGRL